jgi:hypothetical protein
MFIVANLYELIRHSLLQFYFTLIYNSYQLLVALKGQFEVSSLLSTCLGERNIRFMCQKCNLPELMFDFTSGRHKIDSRSIKLILTCLVVIK